MIKVKPTNFVGDAIRFLLAGGLNTILSYLVYLLLNMVISYQFAYALSWLFGLLFIVIFYPSKVFVGSENSKKKIALLILQYVCVFVCGLQCLMLMVSYLGVSEALAALFTMVFTTGLNFILMRLLYRKKLLS
jgi:putative flippase GtrA